MKYKDNSFISEVSWTQSPYLYFGVHLSCFKEIKFKDVSMSLGYKTTHQGKIEKTREYPPNKQNKNSEIL